MKPDESLGTFLLQGWHIRTLEECRAPSQVQNPLCHATSLTVVAAGTRDDRRRTYSVNKRKQTNPTDFVGNVLNTVALVRTSKQMGTVSKLAPHESPAFLSKQGQPVQSPGLKAQ